MATIQDSALYNEVQAVASSGQKPVNSRWECTIHADGKDINTLYVRDLDEMCNFVENYTTEISIEIAILTGDWMYKVVPFKDKLEVTVRRFTLLEAPQPIVNDEIPPETYRYRATLFDNGSELLEGQNPAGHDKATADRGDYRHVRMQLLDPVIEQLRMKSVGGQYRNCTGLDLVRTLLGKHSKETSVADAAAVVKGVTVAANANTEVRQHIVIPHMTPLTEFPKVVNEICGGIYPAGLGYYLMRQQWFLYSPYDVTSFTKSPKTLTIVIIPAGRMPQPERSYRETPTQVIVLGTGEVKHKDNSEQLQLNRGNGVSFIDAKKVTEGFGKVENNKLIVDAASNVNRFVAEKRATGLNFVPESEKRITANYLTEYGKLARRNGGELVITWENSNPRLLYPGMPVRILYLENNKAQETYGCLIGMHTHTGATNRNPSDRRFTSNTALAVFVDRKIAVGDKGEQ